MNDTKEIAAALWAIKDEIEKLRLALERTHYSENDVLGRKIYGVRVSGEMIVNE